MERKPFQRGRRASISTSPPSGPNPVVLRKHATMAPIPGIARIEPGRWLLLSEQPDPEREALAQVWQKAGGQVQRVRRIWAPDPSWTQHRLCLYGNEIFCRVLAEAFGLQLLGPADDLLADLPAGWLGRRVVVVHPDDVEALNYPCHVRSLPAKLFTSGVVRRAERLRELTAGLEAGTRILASEVMSWEAEARFFFYDRRVLDGAVYKGHAEVREAMGLAEQVAGLEGAPFGFVADLGRFQRRWSVISLRPSWSARLRGCNPDKVILAIAAGTRA